MHDHQEVEVLWKWGADRWTMLHHYQSEKYQMVWKMIKEDSASAGEVNDQRQENSGKINGQK